MNTRMAFTLVLALIYIAGMFAFTVAFLVDWIRNFERIRRYWRYAIAAGLALVSLNFLLIVAMPGSWNMVRLIGFTSLPVLFVRVVGFVMLGMYYCARMGYPSFLFLPQEPAVEEAMPVDGPPPLVGGMGPRIGDIGSDLPPAHAETLPEIVPPVDLPVPRVGLPLPQVDLPVPQVDPPVAQAVVNGPPAALNLPGYARDVLAVGTVSVIYSALLFLLTEPHAAEAAQRMFGVGEDSANTSMFAPFVVLLVLVFAIGEEIFFRLGIQNFLARYLHWQGRRYWAAIGLTSLLWTVGHAGVLDPGWVKLAQIFPVGLMLGWLFRRHGVEACMLAHGLFNVTMIGLSPLVLT